MKSRWILSLSALAAACAGVLPGGVAHASYISYLKLEGLAGESNPPGLPDATRIYSLTLSSHTFSETQLYDSTSPLLAVTPFFNSGEIAFYKQPITTPTPYEQILFHHLALTSFQVTTGGSQDLEKVSFQYESPAVFLYLALPGTNGSGSPPGRGGVIPIDSLTITDNTFSAHRAVDATSPTLAAAFANGALFSTASLLVYTDPASETQPDFAFVFDQALISSIVSDASGAQPAETISFAATDATLAPEPAVTALLALGVLAGVVARSRNARWKFPEAKRAN
ncbi:MAG: type VI secretion system tube protein Hcp [Myxococcota bacterium]